MKRNTDGFTLIELLVVIGVIATILGLVVPNFIGIRDRARDVKRKTELGELKTALRLYYNDHQNYPAGSSSITGCGTNGDQPCPVCGSFEFASGGASGCDSTYMKKFPDMNGSAVPGNGWSYYSAGVDDFCLVTTLENPGDTDAATSQTKCATPCVGNMPSTLNYVMCAD